MVKFSVFNELSLPIKNLNEFKDFFKVLENLKENGLNKIRMDKEFNQFAEILPNTTFQQIIGQVTDRDKKRRLLSFQNNSIMVVETPLINADEDEYEKLLVNEYSYNQKSTIGGLACCDIWNTIAVSFNSKEEWDKENINLKKQTIDSDEEIDIKIRNLSKELHFKDHSHFFNDLENEIKLDINQNNFWDNRKGFFPKKIVFCKELEKQVKKIDKNIFEQVISILRDVENNKKLITDYNHSGESSTVHTNPRLKKLRKFNFRFLTLCFDNHIKSLPNAHRIYFLEHKKKVYIGYVGKHLPTKKFE